MQTRRADRIFFSVMLNSVDRSIDSDSNVTQLRRRHISYN